MKCHQHCPGFELADFISYNDIHNAKCTSSGIRMCMLEKYLKRSIVCCRSTSLGRISDFDYMISKSVYNFILFSFLFFFCHCLFCFVGGGVFFACLFGGVLCFCLFVCLFVFGGFLYIKQPFFAREANFEKKICRHIFIVNLIISSRSSIFSQMPIIVIRLGALNS